MNESTIFSEGHIKRFALQKLWSLIRYLEPSYPPFLEVIMSKLLTMKIEVLVFPASYNTYLFILHYSTVILLLEHFHALYFLQWQLFILMKVTHRHTRTGMISGNFNMLSFLYIPCYFTWKSCLPRVFLTFRFRVEKFSDSGNSRRFDYQDSGPVSAGFMTSTPQTKSQAVFSPPKSYQVSQITCHQAFDD